ncbi:MAG: preprotein translocase subunit YajC [Promicromonosporaceae bacterium]|nr:preprotein translocase subunit YajC [Promicromonosporaceae bacterium]
MSYLLLAEEPVAGAAAGGALFMFLPILLLVGFMFFMSRNQRKKMAVQQAFRSELQPGDEVMTGSGLFGTIIDIDEDTDRITIDSAGSRSIWLRAAISKRVDAAATTTAATAVDEDAAEELADLDSAQREYQKLKDESGK